MKFILGKKIEMTQIWVGEDKKAVTKVQAGPVVVSQIKTLDKDGYSAVQVAFGEKKAKNLSKSVLGHLKNLGSFRYLKEFRVDAKEVADLKVGDKIKAETFAVGDKVTVTGWSKGRGFAGVVKRHGFHGQDKTHGNKDQLRMPGSIGAGGVQRVFKGIRMGGHMGDHQTSAHNIEIIKIDEENNVIYLNGSVPGARGSLVIMKTEGQLKIAQENLPVEEVKEEVVETAPEEIKTEEVKEETVSENITEEAKAEVAGESAEAEVKVETEDNK